jgi:hypothetical protein
MFLGREKYKLEIHWEKVEYKKEGIANIIGCYLSGPVLKEVVQLNEKDFINLDFVNQYAVLVKNFYIAVLNWEGVRHTPDKIFLNNTMLKNININGVPKLRNDDYIVIDTKNHEEEKHMYHLTYPAYLLKCDDTLYDFGSK